MIDSMVIDILDVENDDSLKWKNPKTFNLNFIQFNKARKMKFE